MSIPLVKQLQTRRIINKHATTNQPSAGDGPGPRPIDVKPCRETKAATGSRQGRATRQVHPLAGILVVGIIVIGGLTLIPPVDATLTTITEPFTYTTGFYPPQPANSRPSGWTYSTSTGGCSGPDVAIQNDPSPAAPAAGTGLFSVSRQRGTGAGAGTSNYCGFKISTPITFSCDGEGAKSGSSPPNQLDFDYYITGLAFSNNNFNAQSSYNLMTLTNAAGTTGFSLYTNSFGPNTVTGIVFTTSGNSQASIPATFTANEWWHFQLYGFDCDGFEGFLVSAWKLSAPTSKFSVTVGYTTDLTGVVGDGLSSGVSVMQSGGSATTDSAGSSVAGYGSSYYDNIAWSYTPGNTIALSGNSISVTNLHGFSMDATGRAIITREGTAPSEVIKTYSATNIAAGVTGTANVPNCNRADGVYTATLNDIIYNVYVDCISGGDAYQLRIRGPGLTDPTWIDESCTQQDKDVGNDDFNDLLGEVDLPPGLGQIGTLNSFSVGYNACSTSGTDYAIGSLTFSTTGTLGNGGGKIGVFGWAFNNVGADHSDMATVQLDTNPSPVVNQFCSYQDFHGTTLDYVGGVTANGPTGLYEGTGVIKSHIDGGQDLDVGLQQVYLNTNPYGNAKGLDCSEGDAVILQSNRFVFIGNAFDPAESKTFKPVSISGTTVNRGIAMSRVYQFIAYVSSGVVHVGWFCGTLCGVGNNTFVETGTTALPGGTFVGMEFTDQGETLAVATSTTILVLNTSPATCELLTCDNEGGGDDGGSTGGGGSSSSTSNGNGGGGSESSGGGLFETFILMGVLNLVLVVISIVAKTPMPAMAFGIACFIGYVIGVIVWGATGWPLVFLAIIAIALVFVKIKGSGS